VGSVAKWWSSRFSTAAKRKSRPVFYFGPVLIGERYFSFNDDLSIGFSDDFCHDIFWLLNEK